MSKSKQKPALGKWSSKQAGLARSANLIGPNRSVSILLKQLCIVNTPSRGKLLRFVQLIAVNFAFSTDRKGANLLPRFTRHPFLLSAHMSLVKWRCYSASLFASREVADFPLSTRAPPIKLGPTGLLKSFHATSQSLSFFENAAAACNSGTSDTELTDVRL